MSNIGSSPISGPYVFIGGDVDLAALATHTNISALLGTGNIGLYTQDDAVAAAYYGGTLSGIAAGMAGTGLGEAEVNLQSAQYALAWFRSWYQSAWLNFGLPVGEINSIINYNSTSWVNDFAATVTAAHSYGIKTIAPIFSPNLGSWPLDSFIVNPVYASIRSAALLGGGLCIDSPPAYFFQRGSAYQNFVYQEIQWAHANNLQVSVLISPYGDDQKFLYDSKAYVRDLQWHAATPDSWVVENYTPNDPNGVGNDANPNSVAGVALWVANNAQTWSAVSAVPAPTPTLTVSQPGTVQAPSLGGGVTVTETVSATYLAGAVYVGVLTATGAVESSYFTPVYLDDNGKATFSINLNSSGDVVAVEDNLTNPAVFVKSAPVTITRPPATITLTAPGTQQEASIGAGVDVTETVTTTFLNGPIYVGVVQANGNVESPYFWSVPLDANGRATFSAHLAHNGDYIVAETSLSNPALLVRGAPVTIKSPQPTITLTGPRTLQEATIGAGVDVTETIATSNFKGPVYVGVVQANGNVESKSFWAVPLDANGQATVSAHLGYSGDYIVAETSLSNPALLVRGAPVTITRPQASMTLSPLGTQQEASIGGGVDVTETIATSFIKGPIYVGVVQANGNVESKFFWAVPLDANGNASFSAHLAYSGDYIVAETSLTNPALLVRSAAITITKPPASISLGTLGTQQEARAGAGVDVTETVVTSYIKGPIYVGVVQANGNVESKFFWSVPLDTNGRASFSAHLAHNGDYIVAETSLSNPALLVRSAPVAISSSTQASSPVYSSLTQDTVSALQQGSSTAQPIFISGHDLVCQLSLKETLYDNGANNRLVFAAQGPVTLGGNVMTNGDIFDLRAVMADTSWNGSVASLGSYLTSTASGGGKDLDIVLHPQGGSASSVIATLLGAGTQPGMLTTFEQHAILR